MKMAIIVLNKVECLEKLLARLCEEQLGGATILDSHGMAHTLEDYEDVTIIASLHKLLDPAHRESKTIFMVVQDDRVKDVSRVLNEVTGGLDQPDTGILFTLNVDSVEGIG